MKVQLNKALDQLYSSWIASFMSDKVYHSVPFNQNHLIKKERVSPAEFIRLAGDERNNILSAHVCPPVIGVDDDFGSIEVEYRFNKRVLNQQNEHTR